MGDSIREKLDIIDEKTSLSSFDSLFIALNIFLSTFMISLALNREFIASMSQHPKIMIVLFMPLFLFSLFMICLVVRFYVVIFANKYDQFLERIRVIAVFMGYVAFFILLAILLAILLVIGDFLGKYLFPVGATLEVLIGVVVFIESVRKGGSLKKNVIKHFQDNYPKLYAEYLRCASMKHKNKRVNWWNSLLDRIHRFFKIKFAKKRVLRALVFSASVGATVFAWKQYEATNGNIFGVIAVFLAFALILILFGGEFLEDLHV